MKFVFFIVILFLTGCNFFANPSKNNFPIYPSSTTATGVNALPETTTKPVIPEKKHYYKEAPYEINNEMIRVKNNYTSIKKYAIKNKCNLNYAFIIDMRIACYKKRFFVYNIIKDSIINSGLVAHGNGSETNMNELIFSNTPESHCTSLGKYKIGESYMGINGFSYRLNGLDSTNNKAIERGIVLHANSCVPDEELGDYPICFSYGCPMVSDNFLQKLKIYINSQPNKPILLSIIY